jgi:hypothetical protein
VTRAIVLILTNLIWICLTIWYVIQYLSRGSSPSFPVKLPYCLDIPLLYILIKSNCWRNFPAFGLNFKLMTPDSVFMANDLWLVKVKMWILPFKRDLNSKVLVINEGHEEFQLRQYVKLSQTAIWSLAEHRSVHGYNPSKLLWHLSIGQEWAPYVYVSMFSDETSLTMIRSPTSWASHGVGCSRYLNSESQINHKSASSSETSPWLAGFELCPEKKNWTPPGPPGPSPQNDQAQLGYNIKECTIGGRLFVKQKHLFDGYMGSLVPTNWCKAVNPIIKHHNWGG